MFVPVLDRDQRPLMPTTPARARRWIKSIQAEARDGVKDAEKDSTRMRRARRHRKAPCRQPRPNRGQSKGKLPPSTRARWQWKLRLARFLCQIFPVSVFVVENIAATAKKGKRRWNQSFSPLEVGKQWFYEQIKQLAPLRLMQGYETKALREQLGLKKTSKKLAEVWEAHCLDAWVLAYHIVGGNMLPDNRQMVCIAPFVWHHRQFHRFQPEKGGKRKPYGGTLSQGIKRGTLVTHPKWGKVTVGGTMDGRLSLHDSETNKRLTQTAKVMDCYVIKLLRWRTRLIPLHPSPKKGRFSHPSAKARGGPKVESL